MIFPNNHCSVPILAYVPEIPFYIKNHLYASMTLVPGSQSDSSVSKSRSAQIYFKELKYDPNRFSLLQKQI